MSATKIETTEELRAALAAHGIETTGDLRAKLAESLLALDGSPESNKRAEELDKLARAINKFLDKGKP